MTTKLEKRLAQRVEAEERLSVERLLDMDESPLNVAALVEGYEELLCMRAPAAKPSRDFNHQVQVARQQREQRRVEEQYKDSLMPDDRTGRYTPAMLRRFLDWTGETCAYPLCTNVAANTESGRRWHLCQHHRINLHQAVRNRLERMRKPHAIRAS